MNCAGFPQDVYALYALGLLQETEREEIATHLRDKCVTCEQAVRSSSEFWCVFGMLTERLQSAPVPNPSPELRNRILQLAEPRGARSSSPPFWAWTRIAAAAFLLIVTAFVAWDFGKRFGGRDVKKLEASLAEQQSEIQRLQAENQRLQIPATPPPAKPAESPRPAAPDSAVPELQARLKATEDAAAAHLRDLADERARLASIQAELATRNEALAALTRSRDAAEQKYRDAVAATAGTERAASVETASMRARIRDLELQVSVYQKTIQVQQERLNSTLRLASLLRSPSATLVRLAGTQAGRSAAGTALISNNSVVFFASNLPGLAPKRTYQLWLIRKRGPAIVSAGTFSSWGAESPAVEFNNAAMTSAISGLAVTEEPAGGSPLPTGNKILIGTPPA